ncbi:MAG: FHA domain-containing protein [Arthrospira sp. SH-MAG29]|nr:FHA domain-containing protein [Arthrospira sp. SH-MAG29]MBS0017199.1 FHA domain-containing protein [Arthrospira sp. SH-MAG29]
MSLKTDKIATRIQEIHRFLGSRSDRDPAYMEIAKTLEQLESELNSGKLRVKIVSSSPEIGEGFYNLLSDRPNLLKSYEWEIQAISQTSRQLSPELIIVDGLSGSEIQRYPLSEHEIIQVGRHRSCRVKIANEYHLISNRHAEIKPIFNGNIRGWEINDLNSKNGSFINNAALENHHLLSADESIFLGSQIPISGCICLHLQASQPVNSSISNGASAKGLTDADVLYIIIDEEQLLSESHKSAIDQAIKDQIEHIFVILDCQKFGDIYNSLNAEYSEIEVINLSGNLKAYNPGEIEEEVKQKLEKHDDFLEKLAANQGEKLLLKRFSQNILEKLEAIEQVLEGEIEAIKQNCQQTEAQLSLLQTNDLKDDMKKALKKAGDEKDKFFRMLKNDLNQSKNNLLDEFRKSSLFYKIQQFTDDLHSHGFQRGGYLYVQLQAGDNPNATGQYLHLKAIHVCQTELIKWSDEEWQRICNFYGGDGLNGMLKRIYDILNFVPNLSWSESLFNPPENIDFRSILQASVIEPTFESRYKQPSLFGYLFKNLKGQVISGVGTIMLMGSLFIPAGGDVKGRIVAILLPIFMVTTLISYHQDKTAKIQDNTEKLKKDMNSYYQSFIKNVSNNIVQNMGYALEQEERRIRDDLEAVNECYNAYLLNREKHQLELRMQKDQYQSSQRNLEKDLAEVQKFKRL